MKEIHYVQQFGALFVAKGISDSGAPITIKMLEIRGAISWPSGAHPGYYCIFGKLAKQNALRKNPYVFLAEGSSHLKDDLFRMMTDDAVRLRCIIIYADRGTLDSRGWMGFFSDLFDYIQKRQLNLDVYPAPSSDDIDYGVVLIREAFRSDLLQIPKERPTILLRQLRDLNMQTKDYDAFFAFHALRYLLAGFGKFETPPPESLMVKRTSAPSADAWT